jgi:hypothetical protein
MSRKIEDIYPAAHLLLFRAYRMRRHDLGYSSWVGLRSDGEAAFWEANNLFALSGNRYPEKTVKEPYGIALTFVPTFEIEKVGAEEIEIAARKLAELDPLISGQLMLLLLADPDQSIEEHKKYDMYYGWRAIVENAIDQLTIRAAKVITPHAGGSPGSFRV